MSLRASSVPRPLRGAASNKSPEAGKRAALASEDWRGTSSAVQVSVMEDQHQRSAPLIRIMFALPRSMIDRLDERRRHEPDLPSRAELIRRLLEKALGAEAEERGRERGGAGHDPQHKTPTLTLTRDLEALQGAAGTLRAHVCVHRP
jgi:hypothetical protein